MRFHSCLALALIGTVSCSAAAVPDGYLDPTFGQDGRQIIDVDVLTPYGGLAVLPSGQIVLATSVFLSQQWGIGLARLDPDGQVDGSFGSPVFHSDGSSELIVTDMAAQPDGKLVIVGAALSPDRGFVCRFRPNGSLDTTFATAQPNPLTPGCRSFSGNGLAGFAAVALQSNGRILLAGTTATMDSEISHALIVRLDVQGNPDTSFSGDGVQILLPQSMFSTGLTDIASTPNGDVVAVGNAVVNDNTSWLVFQLRGEDGTPDPDFNGAGLKPIAIDQVANGYDQATAVSILPDGRIVVGGQAQGSNGNCPAVARLLPDGTFDQSLDGDGLFVTDNDCLSGLSILDMLVQSNDRIVLAGSWTGNFFATRILPQGGFDTGFGSFNSSWFNFGPIYGVGELHSGAFRIASQAGRLILAGLTESDVPGNSDLAVARLDNDLIFADDLE